MAGTGLVWVYGLPAISVLSGGSYVEIEVTSQMRRYARLSRWGLGLLALGFLLQLTALWISPNERSIGPPPHVHDSLAFASGLALSLLFSRLLVPLAVAHVEAMRGHPAAPPGFDENLWRNSLLSRRGGVALYGMLEVAIVYVAAWWQAWLLVGSWLAFKVASKWEAWKHIGEMSKWWHQRAATENLDICRGIVCWYGFIGTSHMTFLVGTLANVLVALAGAALAKLVLAG